MIRGISDRGESTEVCDMKGLLTLYGDESAFVNASPEYIAREMAAWQAFDDAARGGRRGDRVRRP
jgi:hypothetical protein